MTQTIYQQRYLYCVDGTRGADVAAQLRAAAWPQGASGALLQLLTADQGTPGAPTTTVNTAAAFVSWATPIMAAGYLAGAWIEPGSEPSVAASMLYTLWLQGAHFDPLLVACEQPMYAYKGPYGSKYTGARNAVLLRGITLQNAIHGHLPGRHVLWAIDGDSHHDYGGPADGPLDQHANARRLGWRLAPQCYYNQADILDPRWQVPLFNTLRGWPHSYIHPSIGLGTWGGAARTVTGAQWRSIMMGVPTYGFSAFRYEVANPGDLAGLGVPGPYALP